MERPRSLGELIDATLAVGRLQGAMAAAEHWCEFVGDHWDQGATREHGMLLTRIAAKGDDIDVRIAAYVNETAALCSKISEHGTKVTKPSDIEGWFRHAASRLRGPAPQPPQVSINTVVNAFESEERRDAVRRLLLDISKAGFK